MRAIIQHLRFPFSFLLMPVFLYSIWFNFHNEESFKLILLFFILHLLVYPSSNAYNSTQDKDEGSVGLIKHPLPVPELLKPLTVIMDILAVLTACYISLTTAFLIALYITASRAYSYRKIRLKQYPVHGFLTVFICQGALVYFIVLSTYNPDFFSDKDLWFYSIASIPPSLLIGSIYPLSQIYQHEQDRKDGVNTLSALLGYKGTFLFSGILFALASILILYPLIIINATTYLIVFIACQIPVLVYFAYWFYLVMKDFKEASFKNTMRMNVISSICMNLCFLVLFLLRFF